MFPYSLSLVPLLWSVEMWNDGEERVFVHRYSMENFVEGVRLVYLDSAQ